MPQWVTVTLYVAGGIATLAAASTVVFRLVVKPAHNAWDFLVALLQQLRASSNGVTILSREVQGLAGAVVNLVVAVLDDQKQLRAEHQTLRENQAELVSLVVDLDAEYHRLRQLIEGKKT